MLYKTKQKYYEKIRQKVTSVNKRELEKGFIKVLDCYGDLLQGNDCLKGNVYAE